MEDYDDYDFLFKLMLVGDSGVGKSSLMLKYTDHVFMDSHITTIGVDFKQTTMKFNDSKIAKVQIWDTAGQERFRTITASYYRGAHGILVCFDVTNYESFTNVTMWLDEINKYGSGKAWIMLIGNKTDLTERRQVSTKEAQSYADLNGFDYVETSALVDNSNSLNDKVFTLMSQRIREKLGPELYERNVKRAINQERRLRGIDIGESMSNSKCCS